MGSHLAPYITYIDILQAILPPNAVLRQRLLYDIFLILPDILRIDYGLQITDQLQIIVIIVVLTLVSGPVCMGARQGRISNRPAAEFSNWSHPIG